MNAFVPASAQILLGPISAAIVAWWLHLRRQQRRRLRPRALRWLVPLSALVLAACGGGGGDEPSPDGPPTPPPQAASGPGGSDYAHAGVRATRYGSGGEAYWLFEPADPVPAQAPLIYFLHGFSATDPRGYRAWIDHLVRRGAIVVYPVYQASDLTPMDQYMPNTIAALQDALARLDDGTHVRPQRDRVAAVGHSMGGAVAANLAAIAADAGLPQPWALMSVNACNYYVADPDVQMPLADLARIPPGTLLLAAAAADDALAGTATTRRIYLEASAVGTADKDFVTFFSDVHGEPALVADHLAPLAGDGDPVAAPDALDYHGYWRLFDALIGAAFDGQYREQALGGGDAQRDLGDWSDGVPVHPLAITDAP